MKKSLSRLLAVALAVALVVTCAISGLILPVAAEDEATNGDLLANVAAAKQLYTLNSTEDGSAKQTIETGITLEANTRYALRALATNSAASTRTAAVGQVKVSAASSAMIVVTSAEWLATQVIFTTGTANLENLTLTIEFPAVTAEEVVTTLQVKEFVLLKAPKDGTFNVVPGSSFDTRSSFFGLQNAISTVSITADPDDATNSVMMIAAGDGARKYYTSREAGVAFGAGIKKVTFRYKGTTSVRFSEWSGSGYYKDLPAGATITSSGSWDTTTVSGQSLPKDFCFPASTEWATATVFIYSPNAEHFDYFQVGKYGTGGILYIDDFQVYEVEDATAMQLNETSVELWPGESVQLTATATAPANAYLAAVTWDTSDASVATVENGLVTLTDTATVGQSAVITAAVGEVTATCTIIADGPTVNESIYFENNEVLVNAEYGTQALAATSQLKTAEGYVLDASSLTWTLTGGTTNKYNSTSGAFDGEEVTVATITAAGDLSVIKSDTTWSLANVNPVITVEDALGNQAVAPVKWQYAEQLFFNGNFDIPEGRNYWTTGGDAAITSFYSADKGYNGGPGLYTTGSTSISIYAALNDYLKPSSTYRVTWRFKSNDPATKSAIGFGGVTFQGSTSITADEDGEWMLCDAYFVTGATPRTSYRWGFHPSVTMPSGNANAVAYLDEICVELVDDETGPLLVGGDFESRSFLSHGFTKKDMYSIADGSEAEGGSIAGNTGKMLAVAPGYKGDTTTSMEAQMTLFQPYHTYEFSFRHYGAAGKFWVATYSAFSVAGTGVKELTASTTDEWTEYRVQVVFGNPIEDTAQWKYMIGFNSENSEGVYYIDDLQVREIVTPYVLMAGYESTFGSNNSKGGLRLTATCADGVERTFGSEGDGTSSFYEVEAGTEVTVTVKNEPGYLPVPGTLKIIDMDGNEVALLNSACKPMLPNAGNPGTQFTFLMPAETVRVTCEFVSDAQQNYQWGTIASAVRRETVEGVTTITGMRFLNRIYINGLDWSADELKVTVGGVEYTITEIGAIARAKDGNDLSLESYERRGVCYEYGDTTISVTDYTKQYFDFTVVLPYANVTSDATEYQCRAYMELTPAEGKAIIVYTDTMTDSLDAALSRGA